MRVSGVGLIIALCVGSVNASPAQAITVRDAAIELISDRFPPPGNLVVSAFLHQILDDNRQATALAHTPKGGTDTQQGKKASFFGNTGLVHAKSIDTVTPARADAWARNKWIGKIAKAKAAPEVSHAVASLWWKDKVVIKHDTRDPVNVRSVRPAADPLPHPDLVQEARLILPWSIDMSDVGASSNATGSLDVSIVFDGFDVFRGSVSYDSGVNGGMPAFNGDFAGYESAFSTGAMSFDAAGLTLSGTAILPLDYPAFYQTEEVVLERAGSMIAVANSVPVPPSLFAAASGIGLLGVMGWRRRR